MKTLFLLLMIVVSQQTFGQIDYTGINNLLNNLTENSSDLDVTTAVADIHKIEILVTTDPSNSGAFLRALLRSTTQKRWGSVAREANTALNMIDYSRDGVRNELLFSLKYDDLATGQAAFKRLIDIIVGGKCQPDPSFLAIFQRKFDLVDAALRIKNPKDDPIYKGCQGTPNFPFISMVYASLNNFVMLESRLNLEPSDHYLFWKREVLSDHYFVGQMGGKFFYDDPWYRYSFYGWAVDYNTLNKITDFFDQNPVSIEIYGDILYNIIKPTPYVTGGGLEFSLCDASNPNSGTDISFFDGIKDGKSYFFDYLMNNIHDVRARQKCFNIIDNLFSKYLDRIITESQPRQQVLGYSVAPFIGYFLINHNYPHTVSKTIFAQKLSTVYNMNVYNLTDKRVPDPRMEYVISKLQQ